jgi:hypothetical protein
MLLAMSAAINFWLKWLLIRQFLRLMMTITATSGVSICKEPSLLGVQRGAKACIGPDLYPESEGSEN